MNTNTPHKIPNFPGYFATEDGRIFTQKRKGGNDRASGQIGEPRELKQSFDKRGYKKVSLDIGGVVVTQTVHRLVLLAFVGQCPSGTEGCHYPDPDKTNNNLSNLRWDTHDENIKDKVRDAGVVNEKKCRKCFSVKPIFDFYKDSRSSDGAKTECKACHIQTAKATRDPEKKRLANREYMRRVRAQ